MIIYKRNIERKLTSLRIIFLILSALCFYSLISDISNLTYVSIVALILLSIIVVKDFVVYQDMLQLKKFYFFGIFHRTWEFHSSENILIKTDSSKFGDEAEAPIYDSYEAAETGCLFSIFSIASPPRIARKEYTIRAESKSVKIFLNREEYNLLNRLIQKENLL